MIGWMDGYLGGGPLHWTTSCEDTFTRRARLREDDAEGEDPGQRPDCDCRVRQRLSSGDGGKQRRRRGALYLERLDACGARNWAGSRPRVGSQLDTRGHIGKYARCDGGCHFGHLASCPTRRGLGEGKGGAGQASAGRGKRDRYPSILIRGLCRVWALLPHDWAGDGMGRR
ncbi:hypothetical protein BD626DRAFT_29999 [Schizophyllum amplum]|uniref:Uncharacterized protein n=1 Tax=Schizophyllum amplum TaxID=97359 RepID=A0A550D0H1_9AGAR|nr:hypothetical protein BD626DRAFT_29999 [Auriculariopsis ampla]